jgi:hypothetical protein
MPPVSRGLEQLCLWLPVILSQRLTWASSRAGRRLRPACRFRDGDAAPSSAVPAPSVAHGPSVPHGVESAPRTARPFSWCGHRSRLAQRLGPTR